MHHAYLFFDGTLDNIENLRVSLLTREPNRSKLHLF